MIVSVFLIFFSVLYLSLAEVEDLSISTLKKVLFLGLLFESTIKRYNRISSEAEVTVIGLTHIGIFPV